MLSQERRSFGLGRTRRPGVSVQEERVMRGQKARRTRMDRLLSSLSSVRQVHLKLGDGRLERLELGRFGLEGRLLGRAW